MMVYGFDQKKSYHYDIVAQNWTRVQDGEETSYRGPAGAMTVDDVYILFGGRSGNGQPKQKWFRYTLDNDVPFASTPTIEPWETPTIPTPAPGQRQGLSGEYYAANNTIFFFAGNTANEATTDELWRYNVTSDTFQNMYTGQAVWPTKRAYYASFIDQTNGYIYYFGGKDDTILYNDLWRYNIEENTWRELRPRGTRPSPRWGATISVYNDLVYLYGGNTGDNLGSSDLWVFDFVITSGISVIECDDPDDQDGFYSVNDTVSILFYNSMVNYSITTKAEIDSYWTMAPSLGQDYTGEWIFDDLYRITILDTTGHEINSSTCNITLEVAKIIFDLDDTEYHIGLKSDESDGDWGNLTGPAIVSAVADDPDNGDTGTFSGNDTLTITWSELTNTPPVATKGQLDALFAFSNSLGDDYTGAWTDLKTLVITMVDVSNAGDTTISGMTVTAQAGGNLRNLRGDSQPSESSQAFSGDWGNNNAPAISGFVANDPDDADTVYGNADTLTITFDTATNKPAVTSKTDIDNILTFSASLGTAYTGTWNSLGDVLTVTVTNSASHGSPAIAALTVQCTGSIKNTPGTSLDCTSTSSAISGDWGKGPLSLTLSGTLAGVTETAVQGAAHTIIITITSTDTWAPAGVLFENERQDIINGLLLDQTGGPNGWENTIRPSLPVTSVVRSSDTVVTVTVPATSEYAIGVDEVIRFQVASTSTSRGAVVNSTNTVTVTDVAVSATVSGDVTTTTLTEADMASGGREIYLSLVGDVFVAAAFAGQRAAIRDGLVADVSPANGWNNNGRAQIPLGNIVRVNASTVRIVLPAMSGYDIPSGTSEVITATIPAAAILATSNVVATPTFTVNASPEVYLTGVSVEAGIVAGTGGTWVITVSSDTFVSGATFDAERQNIIDSLLADPVMSNGFVARVSAALSPGDVVRTNATAVSITIPAVPSYVISQSESVQVTVPAAALVSSSSAIVSQTNATITDSNVEAVLSTDTADNKWWDSDLTSGGGKSVYITLRYDQWLDSGTAFDGSRATIISGLDSAQSEGGGWNAQVRDGSLAVGMVTRVNDTTVHIAVPVTAAYSITATEVVTATVAASTVGGIAGAVATPTFSIAPRAVISVSFSSPPNEGNIVNGGINIVLTVQHDQWVSGASFDAIRQSLIDGIVSTAGTPTTGWNGTVTPALAVGNVTRTSPTQVTISLPAVPGYSLTTDESLLATVPASALALGYAPPPTPLTASISNTAASVAMTGSAVPAMTYEDVQSGTLFFTLTVANDMWVSGPAFDDVVKQAIIDGFNGTRGELAEGFNNMVRVNMTTAQVQRISDRVVNVTVSAIPGYVKPGANPGETVNLVVPASALREGSAVAATGAASFVPTGVCGDGLVGVGEECDDGNLVDGDGCQSDCTATPVPFRCWTTLPSHPVCCSLVTSTCPDIVPPSKY
eukprot:TRINITY_DN2164_c0_g1_i2.p1 TRINITY_DN2164_c0_g1~~TRINITY_DN2164_c0_g1_i2.p1  ORF type:complete len:1432 (+),score=338.63 TRINITY_DN2164_c0_g1_i2:411-4706(+)